LYHCVASSFRLKLTRSRTAMYAAPDGRLLAVARLCGPRVRCSRTYRRFGRRGLLRRTRRAYRFRRIRLFRGIAPGRSQAPDFLDLSEWVRERLGSLPDTSDDPIDEPTKLRL